MKNTLKKITYIGIFIVLGMNLVTKSHASFFGNKDIRIIKIQEEFKLIKPM